MNYQNIYYILLTIYIIRILFSPIIVYMIGFMFECNKQIFIYNNWWFEKGTHIYDIIENIKEQDFYDLYDNKYIYFIPFLGLFTFLIYVINKIIILLGSIFIVIPLILIIKFILIPLFNYLSKCSSYIINKLQIYKLFSIIKTLYNKVIIKILNVKIS